MHPGRNTFVKPFVGSIEDLTLKNVNFRQVLFTGQFSQLVVMCLQPGQEIGREMHSEVDQFFRLEQGEARFALEGSEDFVAHAADAVVVPAGTYHNVINTSSDVPLILYTVYSPPNHPIGTVHQTKAEAEAAEAKSGH